jgi:outer membrane protein assembly factor BamB
MAPGARWEGAGQIGAQAAYSITGEVTDADPYRGPLGESDDCLQARFRFVISLGGQPLDDRGWTDTYCAGVGLTQEDEGSRLTGAVARWVTMAANGANGVPEELAEWPRGAAAQERPPMAPRAAWQLTRVGRYSSGIDTAATIAPTYLPGLSALLVASHEGDLIALDVSTGFADPIWRFSPGGTVYGRPGIDSETGRIYFGASDKRLYALDSRGLFLWAFLTGDNVATQPAVFEDLVIFGSEDRNVYAVDRASGKLRWQRETGGAVVSSPALARIPGGTTLVIIGSDDGAAYGLDAQTGAPVWTYETGKPVEAPVIVAEGLALVTSTAGTVTALDPASGEEVWNADNSGRAIRFAPAVSEDRLFVMDQQGYLSAYSLADGRRLWQSLEFDYLGAPLLAGDSLCVAASGGLIYAVDADGRRVNTWRVADASDVTDTNPRLDFGPALGGGAIWTVDSRSVVRRIGAPGSGPERVRAEWVRQVNEPPFAMELLRAAPVMWGERALTLDEGGRVVDIQPESGAVQLKFVAPVEAARVEPLVAGDLFIAANPAGVTALRLSDGQVAWQAQGGTTIRPPVAVDDVILWSAASSEGAAARLVALDAASGRQRWAREFPDIGVPGGVAAYGAAVYTSAPVARLDLSTGETMWEAPALAGGTGSPALSADGQTLFVGRVDPAAGGEIIALRAADGTLLWRTPLGQQALNLLDRPWMAGDIVVIPTLAGSTLGLDAETGAIIWQTRLPAARFGNITVEDGLVYMGLTDGELVALAAETGEIALRGGDREGGLEGYAFAQRPLVFGDRVLMVWGSSLRGYSRAVPR